MQASYALDQSALQSLTNDTFSKYLLDSTSVLEGVKHFLKGEEYFEEEKIMNGQSVLVGVWKQRTVTINGKEVPIEPPINELGYAYTMQILTALLDKIVSTSNLDAEKAADMVNEIGFVLTTTYYENYFPKNEFGFKSITLLDSIV